MRRHLLFAAVLLAPLLESRAGKQKIIVRLREPLKAETVRIRLPEVQTAKGETRDLETRLELGGRPKEEKKAAVAALKLDMSVRGTGKNGVQVTLTLPEAGYVEVVIMDFYGKSLGTLLSGQLPAGVLVTVTKLRA